MIEQIYTDMSMEDYLDHPGISSSRLKYMLQSPADFHASMNMKFEDTRSTILGTATHAAILEPHLFSDRYAMQPEDWGPRNKGEGYQLWKEFKLENAGKICLGYEDSNYIKRVREAALSSKSLQSLLARCVDVEATAFCETRVAGKMLKSRTDILGDIFLGDVKTSSKGIDDESIQKTIFNMGYHFQAADHMHVLGKNGAELDKYFWVFLSTETPAAHIRVVEASPALLEAGRKDFEFALALMEKHLELDSWPGYRDEITTVNLPSYAERYYQ